MRAQVQRNWCAPRLTSSTTGVLLLETWRERRCAPMIPLPSAMPCTHALGVRGSVV